MSKRRIMILAGVMLVFVLVEVLIPPPLNWSPTYAHKDKNPYGAYVLGQLLPGFISEAPLLVEPITLYETDSLPQRLNLLLLSDNFLPEQEDVKVLLRRISAGDHAFVAAHHWGAAMMDTLGFSYVYDYELFKVGQAGEPDSVALRFAQPAPPAEVFRFPAGVLPAHFDSLPANATVLATSDANKAVLASLPWGKGRIIISATPLLFTNYFLMQEKSRPFAQAALGYLPEQQVLWTEFYQLGRMESTSQLRFILGQPALRWSYYLGMGVLLAFILFSLKRRQRPIPVVEPPANTSIAFAQTVARLYYNQQDHRDIALKKISYFKEWLRERYQIPAKVDDAYLQRLAKKTGKSEAEARSLFQYFEQIQSRQALAAEELLALENRLNNWMEDRKTDLKKE